MSVEISKLKEVVEELLRQGHELQAPRTAVDQAITKVFGNPDPRQVGIIRSALVNMSYLEPVGSGKVFNILKRFRREQNENVA